MTLSTKILVFLGAIFALTISAFVIYKQMEISSRQVAIQTQMVEQKQLIDGIVRAQAQWTTKDDMNKFITDNGVNLKAIKDDLDTLHADVNAVNLLVTSSVSQRQSNIPSVNPGPVNPNPVDPNNPDPNGYMKRQQNLSLSEDFGAVKVPFGSVGFSAWQKAPWSTDIKARDYKVSNVVGLDDNQRMFFYNKFSVNVEGKEYVLPIKKSETKQIYPEAKWSWWNPRLHLTVGGGVNLTNAPIVGTANAGATLGIMSYGKFKTMPDVSVLQVGVGYQTQTSRPSVLLNPVNFNIGGILPKGLVNSTYIGPSVQLDTGGNVFAGANLSVGL